MIWSGFFVFSHSAFFFFLANHRQAGHAVTNILAKELTADDKSSSSKDRTKRLKSSKDEPKLEGAQSLEELLDTALSRAN